MSEPVVLAHDWFPEPLPPNVFIGERSWLHSSYAFLHYRSQRPCGLRVGHDTGLYIHTYLDLGPNGEVEIGNYCTLAGAIISTNNRVVIGNYVLISNFVVIADSFAAVPPDDGVNPGSETGLIAPLTSVVIEDNVWMGTRAVLLAGARIGEGAIVGAATVVDFEVPAFAIVAGDPARVVGWAKPRQEMSQVGA